jgi:hypothetical protein
MWKKGMNTSDKTKAIKITRIYAEQGKSLFGELEIETKLAGDINWNWAAGNQADKPSGGAGGDLKPMIDAVHKARVP